MSILRRLRTLWRVLTCTIDAEMASWAIELTTEEMERAEMGAAMTEYKWRSLVFLSELTPTEQVHAAWMAGFVPENEGASGAQKRNDYVWNRCKDELKKRGFAPHHIGNTREERIPIALQLMAQDKFVHCVVPMSKLGYKFSVLPKELEVRIMKELKRLSDGKGN